MLFKNLHGTSSENSTWVNILKIDTFREEKSNGWFSGRSWAINWYYSRH
jgi:hypothetical protein